MKFQSLLDVQTFLAEVGSFDRLGEATDHTTFVPSDEEQATFIKNRSEYVGKMKDYRRSANQKANWRENRTKMMKGIKSFHKSVDGKRFHRKLGRFLASRITRKTNEARGFTGFLEQLDFLVGLNSVKQHLYVEMDYFHRANEQIELEEMILDYAIPLFRTIESKIVEDVELSEDEMIFLVDITAPQDFLTALSESVKCPLEQIVVLVNGLTEELIKEGIAKEDQRFYPVLINRLSKHNWEPRE